MSAFIFAEVRANSGVKTTTVRQHIEQLLEGGAYEKMEPYLLPSGVRGSKAFDQAEAVAILHDCDEADTLRSFGLKDRQVWDHLAVVLRSCGFRVSHGRVIGLLEHDKKKAAEPTVEADLPGDQPDID